MSAGPTPAATWAAAPDRDPVPDLQTMWGSLQTQLAAHRPGIRRESNPADTDSTAVPVTLLTGFLGAGKSSLLAALLMNPPDGLTVRAVVNDVGDLRFDPSFVVDDNLLEVELSNGCGCCAATTDLAETLDRVAAQRPDLIVFETSGVADPLALAQVVEAGPLLRLDRLVAVVDGSVIETQLADPALGAAAKRQLDAAQSVVVSHLDLLAEDGHPSEDVEVEALFARLADLAPGATITPSRLDHPATDTLLPGSLRGARLPVEGEQPAHVLTTAGAEQLRSLGIGELEAALAQVSSVAIRIKGWLRVEGRTVGVQVAGGVGRWSESGASASTGLTIVARDEQAVAAIADQLGCRVSGSQRS